MNLGLSLFCPRGFLKTIFQLTVDKKTFVLDTLLRRHFVFKTEVLIDLLVAVKKNYQNKSLSSQT